MKVLIVLVVMVGFLYGIESKTLVTENEMQDESEDSIAADIEKMPAEGFEETEKQLQQAPLDEEEEPTEEAKQEDEAEYETGNKVFGKTTQDYNVPCAVCLSPRKGTKLVIPARVSCPLGWTEEYYGYYMSSYHGHNLNVNPECVDHAPDVINGSETNTNGVLFYFMQVTCGSGLPCGPYITDRAITCVVCTK
uniref:Uncharacterized protein n=1 Tax=Amphimedon queenslandica TaxID=400682 RepID=A0A1X7UMA5_AMPQE